MIDDSCWEISDEKFNPSSIVIDLIFFWSLILIEPRSFFLSDDDRLIVSDRLIEWSTDIFVTYVTSLPDLISTSLLIANDS